MSLHDDLLAMLEGVADVSLVARLRDRRLGFPDETRLNVFIPDIHLVTPRRQYRFGTNSPELLTAVVRGLRDFRTVAAPGQVTVYQLGDLLDLWRETPGLDPDADVASAIEDEHPDLMEALYHPALDAQFVLGNHDYDLYRWPNYDVWQRHFRVAPTVLALHGDIFDCVEKLPDPAQNVLVHLLAPAARPYSFELGESAAPSAAGDRFNVQDAQSPPEMLRFFDSARGFAGGLTTLVIGHTHHARLVVHEDGDDLFALVDCGAWIENCVTADDPAPRPSAQLGVLGDDEIRIYQLAPRRKL